MNTPQRNDLRGIMLGCHNGACNPYALIKDLEYAMISEIDPFTIRQSKEVAYIIGHIAFLLGQGLGPNPDLITYANEVAMKQKNSVTE